jgi:uncharacterized membrane protein YfcA
VELEHLALAALGLLTAGIGALGGLGGAVILVPVLALTGMPIAEAAPLGLISVAAGSLAAGAFQLREGTVNHRLGVTTETAATLGALTGALLSGVASEAVLKWVLGLVAISTAVVGGRRKGLRNLPDPMLGPEDLGERPGTLAGAYPLHAAVVPYRAHRLGAGLGLMGVAGLVAGLAGTSGGFLKTPAMSEVMRVPVKVAAATTTFTIGITSAAALVVLAVQGRISPLPSAAVAVGSLVGARLGALLQGRLSPPLVRRSLSAVLVLIGLILIATA